jgi:N-dimethylarginine dimethylaminohydrolase
MSRPPLGVQSETGRLRRVLLKRPAEAFCDEARIEREWRELNYTAAPSLAGAIEEHARFASILERAGARVDYLPAAPDTGLDSLYARDSTVTSPRGVILCRMGKEARAGEPAAVGAALATLGVPAIGAITGGGQLEGGDVLWIDERTVVVGQGYRSNAEGIRQLRVLLGGDVNEIVIVPLPHWRGPADCMHLMSLISPVDHDLAVVYSPLLNVSFREWLIARGVRLVEVPDSEFASHACNVLALGPRHCVVLDGNPLTRAALEHEGCTVEAFRGAEISHKGGGGPTCLARPLLRDPA